VELRQKENIIFSLIIILFSGVGLYTYLFDTGKIIHFLVMIYASIPFMGLIWLNKIRMKNNTV